MYLLLPSQPFCAIHIVGHVPDITKTDPCSSICCSMQYISEDKAAVGLGLPPLPGLESLEPEFVQILVRFSQNFKISKIFTHLQFPNILNFICQYVYCSAAFTLITNFTEKKVTFVMCHVHTLHISTNGRWICPSDVNIDVIKQKFNCNK